MHSQIISAVQISMDIPSKEVENMQLLGVVSFTLYHVSLLLYFRKILSPKRENWFIFAAMVGISVSIIVFSYILFDHRHVVYIMMGIEMLSVYILFQANRLQIIFGGCIYMFSLYSSRGIIFSICALLMKTSIKDLVLQSSYEAVLTAIAVLLSLLLIQVIGKYIVSEVRIRHLIDNKGQLFFVVIYLYFQLVYLTLVNDGLYHDGNQLWFSTLYLISGIISKIWFCFVLNHTVKISELIEYELHTRQLQEQLARQLRHYQSYSKFTESYRIFKHDYKNMMTSVKALLLNQEYNQAIHLFDSVHDTMQQEVLVHKNYSDNILLDAILQDAANLCTEKGINFWAQVHLNNNNTMSELDMVRIFTNIINNAIEACEKMSGQIRFIELISRGTLEWTVVEIVNSYEGELFFNNSEPATTKKNQDFHGLGLKIVKNTIESVGGLLFLEPDLEKKLFKVRLCIPLTDSKP